MLVVGLSGGIATGKSTVSKIFREENITIIDADILAREAVAKGTSGFNAIVKRFGGLVDDLIGEDGELNRPALGRCIFNNPELRGQLNSIVHPRVRLVMLRGILKAYLNAERMVVLDVPLLFEGGLDRLCGISIVVAASNEIQISRMRVRDKHLSEEDIRSRLNSQWPIERKIKRAQFVIWNEGSLEDLKIKIKRFISENEPSKLITWCYLIGSPIAAVAAIWAMVMKSKVREIK